jgi:TolB-like protein
MSVRSKLIGIGTAAVAACLCAAGPAAHAVAAHVFHAGAAPRATFKVAGKSYKIDAHAASATRIRKLTPDRFDPITRRDRVDKFYHDTLKERFKDRHRWDRWHYGPYRPEFIYWVWGWPADWRAEWAWDNRVYLEQALWDEWMRDAAFAAKIAALQRANAVVNADYMPPDYAKAPPVAVYADEYINAVYNPPPILAVLRPKGLKADPASDWIASATADSLLSNLSAVPGLFIADEGQVDDAVRTRKLSPADAADPSRAAEIGKAVAVERVVTGSYVADGDQVLFNFRVVNVTTGTVENGVSRTVPRGQLLDGMPGLASSVATLLGYGSPVTPESAPSVASTAGMTVDQRLAAAPPARKVLTTDDPLDGTTTFAADEGPYEIRGVLPERDPHQNVTLRIGPGTDVRGGSISGLGSLHYDLAGTADRPVILRHVEFQQTWGGNFKAQYAIFDDCTFRKTGAWYDKAGFTAKWTCEHCVFRGGDPFKKITHADYGIKFTDCAFVGVTLPEIVVPTPKDKPRDDRVALRADWRLIDHCRFDACTVPQTVFWCATASNYDRCRFPPGRPFESDTPTEILAYVAHPDGDGPDKVAAATPPVRAPLHVVCATQPFHVVPFPAGDEGER